MPQAPSPNMSIIWPTDHDDANAWDVIMDTAVRVVIDGHNHAAGNGAKVAISQLAFDADISFVDAGGNKHAITDLKAIDFFPVDPSAVTALAGAFFLNSADNELYYRTTTGANVKFTNGATLNVGAFTGGFGGDYTGVGALAIFDDASDAYWFNQQVGTAVRQYAKMRTSDLSLFEFKAVGATPVPTQAVTLKSPVALAAGYALTFPGALPGSQQLVQIDAAGNIVISNTVPNLVTFSAGLSYSDPEVHSIAFAIVSGAASITIGNSGAPPLISLGASGTANLPCRFRVGTTISAWNVRVDKLSGAGNTVSAKLWKVTSGLSTTAPTQIGATQSNAAAVPRAINLGQSGLAEAVAANTNYFIEVIGSAAGSEFVLDYQPTAS